MWYSVVRLLGQLILVGSVLGGIWLYVHRAEANRIENEALKERLGTHTEQAIRGEAAMQECLAANALNYETAIKYRALAEEAVAEAIRQRQLADEALKRIQSEGRRFENDQECRRLDDALPSDFVEWLRN
jgi:hypothetical protein